jgi:hypothetical protein
MITWFGQGNRVVRCSLRKLDDGTVQYELKYRASIGSRDVTEYYRDAVAALARHTDVVDLLCSCGYDRISPAEARNGLSTLWA